MKDNTVIICKQCGKESLGYRNYQYSKPRMFCDLKCYLEWCKYNRKHGEENPTWKGNKASYSSKHKWIYRNVGKADKCQNNNCEGKSNNYEWANISGEYKRDIKDWKMLCRVCHSKIDHAKYCINGHKRTELNTRKENGYNRCLTCRSLRFGS